MKKKIFTTIIVLSSFLASAQWNEIDILQSGGETGTNTSITSRAGNGYNYFGNNQILFTYNRLLNYSHAIKTRHNAGSPFNNSIDFYFWKPGDGSTNPSNHAMSLNGGNVGIGTAEPAGKMDILQSGGEIGTNISIISRAGNGHNYFGNNQILFTYNGLLNYSHAIKTRHNAGSPSNNSIDFYLWKPGDGATNPSNHAMSLNGGNVGIGVKNPTEKLQVAGTVYSTEVRVELAAGQGPDYVFEPDYQLRTLQETRTYITKNKHLPEIPSAKEMEAGGVELGDMNMRLLKKIEELTLYLIEQNREIQELKNEVSNLKNE